MPMVPIVIKILLIPQVSELILELQSRIWILTYSRILVLFQGEGMIPSIKKISHVSLQKGCQMGVNVVEFSLLVSKVAVMLQAHKICCQ
jgi:hypothetical protein